MQQINSVKQTAASIDRSKINSAVEHLKNTLATEQQLDSEIERAVHCAYETVQAIAEVIADKRLFGVELADEKLTVFADDRSLMFVPAAGAALDTRLPKPKLQLCRQILVFAHINGQETSKLLKSFRVYADGFCTDGENSWNLSDAVLCMADFLTKLITEHLFESDLVWPEFEEMPEYLQAIPVAEGKPQTDDISKSCIGFECFIDKPSKAN